jgi:hypothetical protein
MASLKQQIERNIEKTNKIKSVEFKSTNNLLFETAPFYHPSATRFRVGTCDGIYSCESNKYIIIGVTNHEQGNGHLQDVFDWFENSCKRDKKDLMVAELMNDGFKKHLIEKRGFTAIDENNVIKRLKDIK